MESPSTDKVMGHDYNNPHRPLLSTNGCDDGGGGPTTLNDSGAKVVVGRRSTSFSPSNPHSHNPKTTTARGGMAAAVAAPLGFPFTAAQWKELERQAMIYKYMVASLPVPSDLLIPATARNFPDPTIPLGNDSLYSLRYPNRDPEPGRCKRTDGKKWRCSREVAAYQKYCERHMHRGRPRSRKPVEVHPTVDSTNKNKKKKTRLNQSTPLQTNPTPQPNHSTKEPQNISKSFYTEPNRVDLGWMIDGEMGARNGIDQQWLHLMDNNKRGLPNSDDRNSIYGTNDSIFHHGFTEEPLNLFSYPDLPQQEDIIQTGNNNCHLFLNSEDYPISRGNDLSPSSLNLSIAMAADSDHNDPKYCPISSWLPFSSGGPLAEVLQPSGSNPASLYGVNAGDSFSSSPSGVLQRALISQSDGSVCNSPTIGLSAALAPEVVAFQWLNSLRAQQTRFIIP